MRVGCTRHHHPPGRVKDRALSMKTEDYWESKILELNRRRLHLIRRVTKTESALYHAKQRMRNSPCSLHKRDVNRIQSHLQVISSEKVKLEKKIGYFQSQRYSRLQDRLLIEQIHNS